MYKTSTFRLHLIVFLWGFTAILGKLIHANAEVLVFYRMLFASVFLYLFIRIIKKDSIKVSKKLLLKLVGIGSLMAFHWLFFFSSIKVSNVSIALSCLGTSTLFAALLEPLIFKRKIDLSEIVMGIVIVICISLIFKVEFQYKLGIIYGLICALLGTIFSVFNGKLYGKTSSGNIIFYEIFGGFLVISLYYVFSGQISQISEISYRDLALLTLLASVFTAYPMFESVNLMKYISPFTLILTVNLEPIYGIILAFFIFGESEKMSAVFYGASLVMILAIVINGVIKARKKSKEIAIENTQE
ncbi:MAG: DMT family transporter [Cloacibacterium normanense]|uniref:DMT family transporter n=1 Tax=Cloacibacterium normanense TaxID=237258 RepID=UPI000ED4F4F6|nr:DMT family transporter [Cloacibacterium normanense]HCO20014.1 permease [Flavobacteriaceae bacterium]